MTSVSRTVATLVASVLFVLAFAASSASARPWGGDTENAEGPRDAHMQQYERRRDFRRQEYDSRHWGETPRQQRLSSDERRQLRRDIQDAGREIYPARR